MQNLTRCLTLFFLLVAGFGCAKAPDSVAPPKDVTFLFDDGTPAPGVVANVTASLVSPDLKIARIDHGFWSEPARVSETHSVGPTGADGQAVIQDGGGSARMNLLGTDNRLGYQLEIAGRGIAPQRLLLPVDSFPPTITVQRGVDVTIRINGETPANITPVVVPVEEANRAFYPHTSPYFAAEKIDNTTWRKALLPGRRYVIGFPGQDNPPALVNDTVVHPPRTFFGFLSEPFTAEPEQTIDIAPGKPSTVIIDFAGTPAATSAFLEYIGIRRVVQIDGEKTNLYANREGLTRLPARTARKEFSGLAGGDYVLELNTTFEKAYGIPGGTMIAEIPFTLGSGESITITPTILQPAPGDAPDRVLLSGRLIAIDGNPLAGNEVRLVPITSDFFLRELHAPAVTDAEGRFAIPGVRRDATYILAIAESDGGYDRNTIRIPESAGSSVDVGDLLIGEAKASFANTTFIDVDGTVVSLAPPHQRPVVIDIWASWCGPCRKSMPGYVALAGEFSSKADFYTLSLDIVRSAWLDTLQSNPTWNGPRHLLLDRSQSADSFDVSIPHYVLLSPSGAILSRGNDLDKLRAKLAEL